MGILHDFYWLIIVLIIAMLCRPSLLNQVTGQDGHVAVGSRAIVGHMFYDVFAMCENVSMCPYSQYMHNIYMYICIYIYIYILSYLD